MTALFAASGADPVRKVAHEREQEQIGEPDRKRDDQAVHRGQMQDLHAERGSVGRDHVKRDGRHRSHEAAQNHDFPVLTHDPD